MCFVQLGSALKEKSHRWSKPLCHRQDHCPRCSTETAAPAVRALVPSMSSTCGSCAVNAAPSEGLACRKGFVICRNTSRRSQWSAATLAQNLRRGTLDASALPNVQGCSVLP